MQSWWVFFCNDISLNAQTEKFWIPTRLRLGKFLLKCERRPHSRAEPRLQSRHLTPTTAKKSSLSHSSLGEVWGREALPVLCGCDRSIWIFEAHEHLSRLDIQQSLLDYAPERQHEDSASTTQLWMNAAAAGVVAELLRWTWTTRITR